MMVKKMIMVKHHDHCLSHVLLVLLASITLTSARAQKEVYRLTWLGDASFGQYATDAAENIAYDNNTQHIFVASAAVGTVKVVDITNPTSLSLQRNLDTTSACNGILTTADVQSVAVIRVPGYPDSIMVAALVPPGPQPGRLVFYNARNFIELACEETGIKPEGIASDGNQKVACINEGFMNTTLDSRGSMTLCDGLVANGSISFSCKTFDFIPENMEDGHINSTALRREGVRLYGPMGEDPSFDLEPEGCTFTEDGKYVFIVFQDNNAYGIFDVETEKYKFIKGFRPHSVLIDPSDHLQRIAPRTTFGQNRVKVYSYLMPDQVASWTKDGLFYFATANEGDLRQEGTIFRTFGSFDGEEIRFGDFPLVNCRDCNSLENLGRLKTSPYMWSNFAEDACGSQACDSIQLNASLSSTVYNVMRSKATNKGGGVYSIGGRSISVFSWNGVDDDITTVWDSGFTMDNVTGADPRQKISPQDLCRACHLDPSEENCRNCPYNSGTSPPSFKQRADDRGVEPECITTGVMSDGTRLVFSGLERSGGIITFDATDPKDIQYQDFLNVRNWRTAPEDLTEFASPDFWLNDGPESLIFISKQDSPIGVELLAACTPLAGQLTLYMITRGPPREDDGSCATTASCPYIAASEGGEGSAFISVCEVAQGEDIRKSFGCDGAVGTRGTTSSDDDDHQDLTITVISLIIVICIVAVLSLIAAIVFYYCGKKQGYELATVGEGAMIGVVTNGSIKPADTKASTSEQKKPVASQMSVG